MRSLLPRGTFPTRNPAAAALPSCRVTAGGVLADDGRQVGFDLLAGCLKALSDGPVLRRYLCDNDPEVARARSVLFASLFVVQAVAFGAGNVSLPLTRETNVAAGLLNIS